MFVNAIRKVEKAMFPIVLKMPDGSLIPSGAGFFINSKGYFVSAAHVFDDVSDQIESVFLGNTYDISKPRLKIIEVGRDDDKDIFLGRVNNLKTPDFLYLSKKRPETGRTLCAAGFPLLRDNNNRQVVQRYYQPSFILDQADMFSVTPAGKQRRHAGFALRDVGLFGMSGGPIFDTSGTVFGIQGSIGSTLINTNGQRQIPVGDNAIGISSDLVRNLLKLNYIKLT